MKFFFTFALFLVSPQAHALSTAQLKTVFCPFSAKQAKNKFDQEFLEHGGLEEIKLLLQGYEGKGKCLELKEAAEGSYELDYKEFTLPLDLTVDADGKIKSSFFGPPRFKNDSLEKIEADLKREPYQFSFYAGSSDGSDLLKFDADKALAISRSNQIFLMRAVQLGIAEGKLKLSDLVALKDAAKLSSYGLIQYWKPESLLSVDTLLNLLVSEKDLTASDLLLKRVSPGWLSQQGKSLQPFLSFREYFLLATEPKAKLGGRAGIAGRIAALSEQAKPAEFRMDRLDLVDTLGWFASTRELCASALAIKDDILERNSRLDQEYQAVQPKEIEKFGLIQTRDSGISQVTVVFKTRKSPRWNCVALTANHSDEIEEGIFSATLARLTNLVLATEK